MVRRGRCLTPNRLLPGARLVVTLLLLLAAAAAHADLQLRPGMTGVADLGAISCETYNAIYPNGPTGLRQATLYYAEGYIYAKTGKSIDEVLGEQPDDAQWNFDSLTDIVVDYCASNPDSPVSAGVAALFDAL